jgi:hypothetical protein
LNQLKTIRTRQTGQSARIDAEIEAILAGEEELLPSSGFLSSVLERIEQEAAAPPPVPFPWKRAVPGILMAAGVFSWGTVKLIRLDLLTPALLRFTLPPLSSAVIGQIEQAGWIAMALGVSLLSWLLARRLAGRGGLL